MKHSGAILKELEKISYSQSRHDIFDDFLYATFYALQSIPEHVKSLIDGNGMAKDTGDAEKFYDRMNQRYDVNGREHMHNAFAILLESTETWEDVIGQAYMDWNISNKYTGQYFTPFSIAKLMTEMLNLREQIVYRLQDAYLKSPAGVMHLYISKDEARVRTFVENNQEAVSHLCFQFAEPIMVNDPSCGSGVMFVAAGSVCPTWALQYGFVLFTGCDIDETCVLMARINSLLYGLHGSRPKHVLELTPRELAQIPEPHKSAYETVINEPYKLQEVAEVIGSWRQNSFL